MDILFLIGRILFGFYWISSGINHFVRTQMLTDYAKSQGLFAPKVSILVSGAMMVIAGVLLLLGTQIVLAIAFLVVFLLTANLTIHQFWKITDEQAKMMDMVNFMKNMALIGALLMMLMVPQPWLYSI